MLDDDIFSPAEPTPRELSKDTLALITNGLDFLDKAREELEARKPKFSVISFWTAVEILLKVPLVHEHWTLVISRKQLPKKETYQKGDFQSVTYEDTRNLLRDVLGKGLNDDTHKAFEKIRKHRNRLVHFYHHEFTKADIDKILKEQADAWFALNRLMTDEWAPIFGANHSFKLAFSEKRLVRGSVFYAEKMLQLVQPELEALAAQNLPITMCPDCHQNAIVTRPEETGHDEFELTETRCRVCTSSSHHVLFICPECDERQSMSDGDEDFVCEHCKISVSRYELLDGESYRSLDEQLNSPFPAGCTTCMSTESVCTFGNGYLCTQCLTFYDDLEECQCCGHLSDSVPAFSNVGGCSFCEGSGPRWDD